MEIFNSKERKCVKLNIKVIPSLLLEMLTYQLAADNAHLCSSVLGVRAMIPALSLCPEHIADLLQTYSTSPSAGLHLC